MLSSLASSLLKVLPGDVCPEDICLAPWSLIRPISSSLTSMGPIDINGIGNISLYNRRMSLVPKIRKISCTCVLW